MEPFPPQYGLLLLAAGASKRMGRPKQLLPWGNGTLLSHAVFQAEKTDVQNRVVVLGANASTIQAHLGKLPDMFVVNPEWEKGMGSSIAFGIAHLLRKELTLQGILIMLADQPLLDFHFLKQLRYTFESRQESIIATKYLHGAGVPAFFGKKYFAALRQLQSDFGARDIIRNNADDLYVMDPKGKALDIDTLETYQKLYADFGLSE